MDKKLGNSLAMFLLGATPAPRGLDRHTHDAVMATKRLKHVLDQPSPGADLANKIRDRRVAAAVYTLRTNKPWPF